MKLSEDLENEKKILTEALHDYVCFDNSFKFLI